jgi:formylglycine-generating enzyme required for sulfatase activity
LDLTLEPGSYRLTFEQTATRAGIHYPVVLAADEQLSDSVVVPLRSAVPDGFAYVPEGRFLFGSANEELRTGFLETVPLHAVTTRSFLIARHETTIGEWIEFLDSLPSGERRNRIPRGSAEASGGFITLHENADKQHGWTIDLRPVDNRYHAHEGEPLVYKGRDRRAAVNWHRLPVTGISAEDAEMYCRWLATSGRVPGARLCTENEWERAARGADAREFPHGNELRFDDANFDLTYGRNNDAYGPDEVGSHPQSRSPFDVDDMVGNVWEMTTSNLDKLQVLVRGGSFYQFRPAQRSSNRQPMAAATRDHTVGLRVCATVTDSER